MPAGERRVVHERAVALATIFRDLAGDARVDRERYQEVAARLASAEQQLR
jgi:hypothetical protein